MGRRPVCAGVHVLVAVCGEDPRPPCASRACRKDSSVLGNVFNLTDRSGRARHLIGRRSRRLEAEAVEVAEIDRWLTKIRSGPEMVLHSAHPASVKPARPATASPARRNKKRRR